MKRIAVLFMLLPVLLFGTLARAALPTVDQVQAEVRAGRYEQAESMMREVVAARPESARARYVYAEILARTGKRAEAVKQVAEARRIDPAIGFTDRTKLEQFERQLQAGGKAGGGAYAGPGTGTIAGPDRTPTTTSAAPAPEAARRAEAGGSGIPSWIWLAGAALLGVAVWRMLAARRSARTPPMGSTGMAPMGAAGMGPTGGYPGGPGAPGVPGAPGMPGGMVHGGHGYAPGMQPGMAPVRQGPGMMGVGLGVAGGLAAGMLAERMLNGNEAQAKGTDAAAGDAGAGAVGSGGIDGTAGADGFSDQPVDFGHGAGWDGGGESIDAGGGDSGSDGW